MDNVMNYSVKVSLEELEGATVMDVAGRSGLTRRCVVIPIDNARGTVTDGYRDSMGQWHTAPVQLALTAWQLKEHKWGRSHILRPGLSGEVFKAMNDEQRRAIPIVGNMTPMPQRQEGRAQAPAPTAYDIPADGTNIMSGGNW